MVFASEVGPHTISAQFTHESKLRKTCSAARKNGKMHGNYTFLFVFLQNKRENPEIFRIFVANDNHRKLMKDGKVIGIHFIFAKG